MARKAGVITIDLEAGTSKFVQDLEKAKGQVREFGGHMTSSMASSSAAVRLFEGDVTHNLRAVERFLATTLGLGPALRAAFPVVGAIAFGGVIFETGKKVYDFFREVEEGPKKISGAFRDLNAPLELTNTQLDLANARLENTLAKLNNKPENHFKVALLEAKEAAEKLGDALQKDLATMDEYIKKQAGSVWSQWIKGLFGDKAPQWAGFLQKEISDPGGFRDQTANVTDLSKLKADYAQEIGFLQRVMQEGISARNLPRGVNSENQALYGLPALDTGAENIVRGVIARLQSEMQRIGSEQTGINLRGQVGAAQDVAEQRKPILEELNRLQEQLNRATENGATAEQKISEEERNQIQDMAARNVLNSQTLALVEKIYDAKRLEAYNARLRDLSQTANEGIELSERMGNEQAKAFEHTLSVVDGLMAHLSDQFRKGVEEAEKMREEVAAAQAQQQVNLVGLQARGHNPLGTLSIEQGMELQTIAQRYHDELNRTVDANQRQVLLGREYLEILKLQTEYAKKQDEIQQKGVKDFFLEMEDQAQTAGNILNQSMHQALEQVSDELAKLLTGQKTHFGKMLQQLGEEMLRKSIQSTLHTGLGKLGELIYGKKTPVHKPTGNPDDPVYVHVTNPCQPTLPPAPPLTKTPLPDAGSILRRLGSTIGSIGGLFGGSGGGGGGNTGGDTPSVFSVDSSVTYPKLAGGGDVDPGQPYWVGDGGEPELFTPRSAGTVTPMSRLGGHSFTYHIDARGADLGAGNRVARAIEMAHSSAIRSSVVATAERNKRTPHRS
jgi:hypothetical protein